MAQLGARSREGIGMTSLRTRRRLIARLREQGIGDEHVLDIMEQTPRHLFIDEALAHRAYEDTALPIGDGQTISQPFVVALMTQLALGDAPRDDAPRAPIKKVLEIGTGCGYQTAILSQLAQWVWTIERIGALQKKARARLSDLGYRNISFMNGDGFKGWPANRPFDAIVVTAAPPEVPPALRAQLGVGGRLVIPVGGDTQRLRIITRTKSGHDEQQREAVRFVPMLDGRRA